VSDQGVLKVIPSPAIGCEPEEAPAKRFQSLPITVSAGSSPWDPNLQILRTGIVPVTSEMPASEAATLLRARCGRCVHFRNDHWTKIVSAWSLPTAPVHRRKELDGMIEHYARACNDGEITPKERRRASIEIMNWGACAALTEDRSDLVIVHPDACCPDGVTYYRDRDREQNKAASAAYDAVMRAAQGK